MVAMDLSSLRACGVATLGVAVGLHAPPVHLMLDLERARMAAEDLHENLRMHASRDGGFGDLMEEIEKFIQQQARQIQELHNFIQQQASQMQEMQNRMQEQAGQ